MADITDKRTAEIPRLSKFMTALSTDSDYRATFASVGKPNTRFGVDSDVVFVRVCPLDCTSQRFVTASVQACFPYLCHYSLLAGHPDEHRMYKSMRTELYGPHTANDAYVSARDCQYCTETRVFGKNQRQLKLFFPNGLLEYVCIHIPGPCLQQSKASSSSSL